MKSHGSRNAPRVPPTIRCGCRLLLGAIAIGFIGLFLLLPLAMVFNEALADGAGRCPAAPSSSPTRWPRSA